MKNKLPIIMIVSGLLLFVIVWTGYQKTEQARKRTDALRDLVIPQTYEQEEVITKQTLKPTYDPTDLDQTPPGVTPFIPTTVCLTDWGNHLRQYCDGGDAAPLELIEGGDGQTESMRVLTLCLDELLHQVDTYETDLRPMDSTVEQNETNRQDLACKLTKAYGNSPVFDNGSVYYMVKEHIESGNIKRLENR